MFGSMCGGFFFFKVSVFLTPAYTTYRRKIRVVSGKTVILKAQVLKV